MFTGIVSSIHWQGCQGGHLPRNVTHERKSHDVFLSSILIYHDLLLICVRGFVINAFLNSQLWGPGIRNLIKGFELFVVFYNFFTDVLYVPYQCILLVASVATLHIWFCIDCVKVEWIWTKLIKFINKSAHRVTMTHSYAGCGFYLIGFQGHFMGKVKFMIRANSQWANDRFANVRYHNIRQDSRLESFVQQTSLVRPNIARLIICTRLIG